MKTAVFSVVFKNCGFHSKTAVFGKNHGLWLKSWNHHWFRPSDLVWLIWYVSMYHVEYSSRVAYQSLDRQDKRMDELNLFIDYHTKYIVSII